MRYYPDKFTVVTTSVVLMFSVRCDCYLTSKPNHVTAARGSSVRLSCRSDTGEVEWRHIPTSLGSRQSYVAGLIYANGTVRVDHIRVHSNGSLHIDPVTDDAAGVYSCEDNNEAAFAELNVVGERVFTEFYSPSGALTYKMITVKRTAVLVNL